MNNWTRFTRPLAALVLCGTVAASLQGCVEMAVGSAVVGTLAATDRRTFGAQTEDKAIVFKGEGRVASLVGGAGHVNVASFNRKVLLTGEVRDEAMKAAVEREVAAIEGVQSVVNDLEIAGVSSFTSRSNDSLLTGRVKAAFVDTRDLYANSIKVVTERGIVYLMGRVTQREGHLAAEVASNISGVQKVVKVFEYISEEDYRRLTKASDTQGSK
ncbi:BON domain-containing protein [Noviherbaspirillum sp. CPCC 100848]|uniref:BON domain-containing protein n=1 Tax=Noviherbaspirillum album TaxID=3080276 RepID=A0ABU6J547_9BURK|nr:BON domain-containing protein [Noviherbaspirillum sp. CPCC 100848]MEC4718749.1 BON domain-containing protein [Noviherbaspirillum sp. CPCC 100848]